MVDQEISQHRVAEGSADERCHHRVSQGRAPLSQTESAKESGHYHRFVSMSDMKYDALTAQGIEILERVPIPDKLVPAHAHVEITAKKAAGYYSPETPKPDDSLDSLGRSLNKY